MSMIFFALFRSTDERDAFFDVLNTAHPNLQFTMETKTNSLPFLDVSVSESDGFYNTQVYRKPTNTGVLMNYECMAPTKWKKALIKCLLNRALRISSSFEYFSMEMNDIRENLHKNGYPNVFVNKIFNDFVEHHEIDADNFPHQGHDKEKKKEEDKRNTGVINRLLLQPQVKMHETLPSQRGL